MQCECDFITNIDRSNIVAIVMTTGVTYGQLVVFCMNSVLLSMSL